MSSLYLSASAFGHQCVLGFSCSAEEGLWPFRENNTSSDEELSRNAVDAALERQALRDFFNLDEIHLTSIFERFDRNKSGNLECTELHLLLCELRHGAAVTDEEQQWILKLCDKNKDDRINKPELLMALQSWHGYIHLPARLHKLFDDSDIDKSGYLDKHELKRALSNVNHGPVSVQDAQSVLDTADVLADGKLGRYELLGAVGTWYINVGRRPTPAMSLAFVANNRTGNKFQALLNFLMAMKLASTAYFPLQADLGSGPRCDAVIGQVLLMDGYGWLILGLIVLMKGHWVAVFNVCLGRTRAWRFVYQISWGVVWLEVSTLTIQVLVNLHATITIQNLEKSQTLLLCNPNSTLPINVVQTVLNGSFSRYSSLYAFCKGWFSYNLAFNFACVLAYYAYIAYRFHKARRADCQLQEAMEEGALQEDALQDLQEDT